MGVLGDGVLCFIQAVVFVYDIVTYPLYTVAQRPWVLRQAHSKDRSKILYEDADSIVIRAHHKMTKPLQVKEFVLYRASFQLCLQQTMEHFWTHTLQKQL